MWRFSTAQVLVPLTLTLFKGQLYKYVKIMCICRNNQVHFLKTHIVGAGKEVIRI